MWQGLKGGNVGVHPECGCIMYILCAVPECGCIMYTLYAVPAIAWGDPSGDLTQ